MCFATTGQFSHFIDDCLIHTTLHYLNWSFRSFLSFRSFPGRRLPSPAWSNHGLFFGMADLIGKMSWSPWKGERPPQSRHSLLLSHTLPSCIPFIAWMTSILNLVFLGYIFSIPFRTCLGSSVAIPLGADSKMQWLIKSIVIWLSI